jgi:hypothetical protein
MHIDDLSGSAHPGKKEPGVFRIRVRRFDQGADAATMKPSRLTRTALECGRSPTLRWRAVAP